MSAEKFWSEWLKITMLIVLIAGILLTLMSNIIPVNFIDKLINKNFFHGVPPDASVIMLKNWFLGVSGAVMAGWGSSMLFVVSYPFRHKEKWAWQCIFYPVILWYVLDTSISLYFGVIFNVIINSILFLQIIAPLMFLRNSFFEKLSVAV